MSELKSYRFDDHCYAFYLKANPTRLVMLHALLEGYDGVATVRTVDGSDNVSCILVTPSRLEECRSVLEGMKEEIQWEPAEEPENSKSVLEYIKFD